MRSYAHIDNHHKGLLKSQITELKKVKGYTLKLLAKTSDALIKQKLSDFKALAKINTELITYAKNIDQQQIIRIQNDSSKTRLSILYYGIIEDARNISKHTLKLLQVYQNSFKLNGKKR